MGSSVTSRSKMFQVQGRSVDYHKAKSDKYNSSAKMQWVIVRNLVF